MVRTGVLGIIVIVLMVLGNMLLNRNASSDESNMVVSDIQNAVRTFSVDLEKLADFKTDRWKQLNDKEKISLFQYIADIQCIKLGISNVTVRESHLDERIYGIYKDAERTVYINDQSLGNDLTVQERIDTVIHEVFHSYQCAMIEAYEKADASTKRLALFKDAVQYKKEFEHYANGLEDNLEAYIKQKCEKDAREYADNETKEYLAVMGEIK